MSANREKVINFASWREALVQREEGFRFQLRKHPSRVVLLSFLLVIMLGTWLLMLPRAAVGDHLSFVDALFTATSATCVTGLIVVDTAEKFTLFGQIVILLLIQIGGLGLMTFSTFFIYVLFGRLSVIEREIVQGAFSQNPIKELTQLLKLVFGLTLSIELIGAICLMLHFGLKYPLPHAAYLSLFHAVSAFCNAGFSLFSDSLVSYRGDVWVNMVISVLIVLGGLGFVVLFDLFRVNRKLDRWFFRGLMFHSRLVLISTAGLILAGFIVFFAVESHRAFRDYSLIDKIMAAFFQSVTTRTAGFNTVYIHILGPASLFMMVLLMFIGASPGSCGGGIKTSTFWVIMASVKARLLLREDVNIMYRRIPENTVSKAISIVFFSGLLVVVATLTLLMVEARSISEPQISDRFIDYLFEVVSAFATVGLSTGLTPTFSSAGKVLLTILMFVGRLGPLTLVLAMQSQHHEPKFRYVKENLMVG